MHILFLSDNFPPEGNAPAARLYEHAASWVKAGHKVTVITCAPNFPEGRLYDGYRNSWCRVEDMDGIRVVRVKTYITANEGFLKRSLDYMSFMIMGFFAGVFQRKPDIVVGTSPQFFCAIGAWMLAAVRRKPFVFELRDLWPASIVAVGAMESSRVVRLLERLELFLYRKARIVVPVTYSFKHNLIERGIDSAKIHVVRNGVDLERYHPVSRDEALAQKLATDGKFVVGYLGTHGMAHGIDKVVEAAELLRDRKDILFLLVGSGAARGSIEQSVAEKALKNVCLVPRRPRAMMPGLWSLCDVSLVPLKNDPLFSTVIPSKLLESVGMGVPVIAFLPEGEATGIVKEEGVGVVVPAGDSMALAESIAALRDKPEHAESLRSACLNSAPKFSRQRQADKMMAVFEEVLRGSTG